MARVIDRRSLFQLTGAAALFRKQLIGAQAPPAGQPPAPGRGFAGQMPGGGRGRGMGNAANTEPFPGVERRATVSIANGEDRRKNVYNALMAIDKELQAKMKGKKYVVIKPNFVSTANQLAAFHADAARGVLDYLDSRFKGTAVIAESSAGDTNQGYDNYKYRALPGEYKKLKVQLIDLNDEAKFVRVALLDHDLHMVPCRLAARLVDPEAFVISAAMLKTHNTAIATLAIKNMALGAPLHSARTETARWNEKRKFHVGLRQTHYNIMLTAARLDWHASILDGYEGMEGNGPGSGTPVPSRIALASTDFVAIDRTGAECMGVDPEWLGYAKYCGYMGLGQFDPAKIDVIGAKVADVKKAYRMHPFIEQELKWQGPTDEITPNLGWTHTPEYNLA